MADKCHLLARFRIEGDVIQDILPLHVGKVHIEHPNIALQLGIGQRAVSVGVFPRPQAGMLFRLDDIAVFVVSCVHKGDIPLVRFRFLIHQVEDPFGTGKSHDDAGSLLRDHADRPVKASAELQKSGDRSKRERSFSIDRNQAADDCY